MQWQYLSRDASRKTAPARQKTPASNATEAVPSCDRTASETDGLRLISEKLPTAFARNTRARPVERRQRWMMNAIRVPI